MIKNIKVEFGPRIEQDPHKEWVRIQEGCVMPEEKEEVVIFDGECQFDCEYQGNMIFVENTEQVVFNVLPLWWRHRHPDPEV